MLYFSANGPGIRTSIGRLDFSGLYLAGHNAQVGSWPTSDGDKFEHSILARATSTDPWSIQPGVVWEFIARTKTASDHLYRGLPDGPGISQQPVYWGEVITCWLVYRDQLTRRRR